MKKLFLGILASTMLYFGGMAESIPVATATQTSIVNSQMVILVNASRVFYTRGETLAQFTDKIGQNSATGNDKLLVGSVYSYLSTNKSNTDIMNGNNDILFTIAMTRPSISNTGALPTKWCWSCIGQFILDCLVILIKGGVIP